MTHFYDVSELNIIIRRSNKSKLFEDSAQKATGKKNVKRANQKQASANCRPFALLDMPDEGS
jgi:hypothetical protein